MFKPKKKTDYFGGSWKVAYADFITAMMGFFLVMWILGQDAAKLEAIQEYFRNPPLPYAEGHPDIFSVDAPPAPTERSRGQIEGLLPQTTIREMEMVVRDWYRLFDLSEDEDPPANIRITSNGMQLVLFNRSGNPMFERYSDDLTDWGRFIINQVALLADRPDLRNLRINVEGHSSTDFVPPRTGYTVWDLSMDRANRVRRQLERSGVEDHRFQRIAAFGSQFPLPDTPPGSPLNDRLTITFTLTDPEI